jgi:hypothetical protein
MAKLNTKSETAKLEQLILIVEMISKVDRWLDEERKYLNLSPTAGMYSKWLFESKAEWLERYKFKLKVKDRLVKYYSTKCFNLYMNSEIIYAEKEAEKPLGVFKEMDNTVDDFFEHLETIIADHKKGNFVHEGINE